jgi:replicative DNA helicase
MVNQDTLAKYGQSFQTKTISVLLSDVKLVDTLIDVIDTKFFESEANKWIVEQIKEYYSIYKGTPSLDVFKVEISKVEDKSTQKAIIDQLKVAFTSVGNSDLQFVKDEFKSFCINQNLKNVIVQSVDLLKAGNYDTIKELVDRAMKVGIENNFGMDYVLDYDERTDEINRSTVATDWDTINELMDGGLGPGELGVIVAPSGVGKTWVLCALGAAAVKAGKSVVHYSMELSEKYVGYRYDTVFTQFPSNELSDKKEEVRGKISKLKGRLMIKYFPPKSVTTKQIESHIEKLTAAGNKPDLVIIDYADLLNSYSNKSDSTYGEQGGVYIELRGLGGLLQIPIWTASQTNRSGIDAEVIEADKIADSYAKVMNADFIVSLSRQSKDKLSNTARMHVMKNRFGPDGLTFPCKMDTNKGILEVYTASSSDGILAAKESKNGEVIEKQLLHKKYIENMDMG